MITSEDVVKRLRNTYVDDATLADAVTIIERLEAQLREFRTAMWQAGEVTGLQIALTSELANVLKAITAAGHVDQEARKMVDAVLERYDDQHISSSDSLRDALKVVNRGDDDS